MQSSYPVTKQPRSPFANTKQGYRGSREQWHQDITQLSGQSEATIAGYYTVINSNQSLFFRVQYQKSQMQYQESEMQYQEFKMQYQGISVSMLN
jgi:hypothetical protein